jgi:peptide/nickel transport system substrate-binding protein
MRGEDNYWTRTTANRVSRRAVLRLGAVGAGGLAAAFALACGGGKEESKAGTPAGGPAAAGTAAPGEQPRYGGVISQRLPNDPDRLDSHQSTTYVSVWPHAPCFNQLVQFQPDKPQNRPDEIIPDLATSWEQPDAQTVVFKLKQGVKFHDGSDFTSEDPKVQIEWIKNPPQGKVSPRKAALDAIAKIETPDPLTLKLTLSRPNPSLLMNLASHYFTIGQAKDILANGEIGPKLIGTGPFKLKQYERGNFIELEKNPNYHIQGRPYLDGLKFFIVRDYSTALTNFIQGQYQLFYELQFVPSDGERAIRESGGKVEVVRVLSTLRDVLFMNARRKPYDDVRVRQAISLALDRDAAMKVVKEGAAKRGGYMLPGGAWAISEQELRQFDGYDKPNIDKAKQLLQQAGVSTPLEAVAWSRTDFKPYAEFVKDQLAKIGINVNLNLADTATSQPKLQQGDFDIGPWLIAINVDDPDAVFAEIATSNAVRNWSAVKDPQLDALFEKQSVTSNFEERKKIVQELERKALSLYQVAVLYFEELVFGRAKTVRNMTFHSSLYTNRRMENVWLAQ